MSRTYARLPVALLILLFSLVPCVNAAEEEGKKKKKDPEKAPKVSVTHGTVNIAGKELTYTATAGKLLQKSDDGKQKAGIFYVSYTAGQKVDPNRPVTFCFNGGPGSCSVWLHMGMLGPYRVKAPDDASYPRPPFKYEPNPHSLLDVTDLVFIDPVSTGYSRPAKGEEKKQFHGYREDLRSVGQFIHDYTSKNQRWGSPKFVLGESYGGLRAAGLSGVLQDRYNMYLNGVVLISAVVDFSTLAFQPNNDLPYILFLPSYAATAHHHKALAQDLLDRPLHEVVAETEKFAMGPYARALLHGNAMPEEQRKEVAAQMARLTGLSRDYVWDANLRVSMPRFGKELLRDRGLVVGRFDSRYTGVDRDNVGGRMEHDPSRAALFGIFTGAMNSYLRSELKYEDERVYEILTGNVHPWNYDSFENRYVSAGATLRNAIAANPYLKVFAACGHHDLATPQFAMQHTRDHMTLTPDLRKNFITRYYQGGHMMYVYEPAMQQLRKDLIDFYQQAAP